MNNTQNLLKEEIPLPSKINRPFQSIFDSARYLKDKNQPISVTNKNRRSNSNENLVLPNLDLQKSNEGKVDEDDEEYYHTKISKIVLEIMKHRILIKLKKNIMSLVDGKIICFSDLIKIMCSYNSFNYRIDLEELDRENMEKILDYLDIIEWNKSRYMWENKEEELNKWYNGIENMLELEQVSIFKI